MKYSAYEMELKEGKKVVLSCVPPEVANEKGLQGHQIIGFLKQGNELNMSNFTANTNFLEFLHRVIGEEIVNDPFYQDQAKKLEKGSLAIIDQRVNREGNSIPPEDFIGSIEVENSEIVYGSYKPNYGHLLLNREGMFQLPKFLQEKLVEWSLR